MIAVSFLAVDVGRPAARSVYVDVHIEGGMPPLCEDDDVCCL